MEEKKKEYTAEEFKKAYEELCEKMGYRIVVNPVLVPTNHQTFEIAQQSFVGTLTKVDSSTKLS